MECKNIRGSDGKLSHYHIAAGFWIRKTFFFCFFFCRKHAINFFRDPNVYLVLKFRIQIEVFLGFTPNIELSLLKFNSVGPLKIYLIFYYPIFFKVLVPIF